MDPLMFEKIKSTGSSNRINHFERIQRMQDQHPAQLDIKKLKQACQDFEAIFIKQMLDSMRKTIPRTELIERNLGEEIFEDMLYTEYSKILSRRGSIGIADLLFRQLAPSFPSKE